MENKPVVNQWLTSGERETGVEIEIQTTMYKINKLQGYTAEHRENGQYFMVTTNGFKN